MGLFGPSVETENKGGRVRFFVKCRRCKGGGQKIYGDSEREAKKEYSKHESFHNEKIKRGARDIKKLAQRAKKGKCSSCGKDPCKMDRKGCVEQAIGGWGSSMEIDMSDPGTFDEQLKWYRDNM